MLQIHVSVYKRYTIKDTIQHILRPQGQSMHYCNKPFTVVIPQFTIPVLLVKLSYGMVVLYIRDHGGLYFLIEN